MTILIGIFRGFPQSLQTKTGILPEIGYDRFLSHILQFIIHLIILMFTEINGVAILFADQATLSTSKRWH
jgi:hypothetical protein